jgi:hypothetical protein
MNTLPEPRELERICKGLAALDAVLCEDWESRCYSFNAKWAKGERMASMRNGSGDDWFIVFAPAGVFVKSFWHEYPHGDVAAIYAALPTKLVPFLTEPAFLMEDVTFGGWHSKAWTLRGDEKPMKRELAMLTGAPKTYRAYASSYFELELPVEPVAHVLAGRKIDEKVLEALGSERTLKELQPDLAEIGYGS